MNWDLGLVFTFLASVLGSGGVVSFFYRRSEEKRLQQAQGMARQTHDLEVVKESLALYRTELDHSNDRYTKLAAELREVRRELSDAESLSQEALDYCQRLLLWISEELPTGAHPPVPVRLWERISILRNRGGT